MTQARTVVDSDCFSRLFGQRPFTFQLRAARRILAGHNVVLRAPTGSGKTRAALFPWLASYLSGRSFTDRLIYALPVRTLVSALYEDTKRLVRENGWDINVTIQMGGQTEDSLFEGQMVFTTIDQILSAYIGVPVSGSPRMANMAAGAIIGSYIVFDEFHLLEPAKALATALDLADRFSGFARLLLMTATYSDATTEEVRKRAHADLVSVGASEVQGIPSQRGKRRVFVWHNSPISAESVVAHHTGRSIAVVNTVDEAQKLYRVLEPLARERWPLEEVLLLHSRFLPDHRRQIELRVLEAFGKEGRGGAILVATQTVEVGLNISSDALHTELSPAPSVFQRAGRCARFEGEAGTVHVYSLHSDRGGRPSYLPYQGDGEMVDRTRAEIEAHQGSPIGFVEEEGIVNRAVGELELDRLLAVAAGRRQKEVESAITTGDRAAVRTLVRAVDSVNIIVHDDPGCLDLASCPEQFSVDRSVVRGLLARIEDSLGDKPAPVVRPVFDDQEWGTGVTWEPVTAPSDLRAAFTIALRTPLATYSYAEGRGLGLELGVSGTWQSSETRARLDPAYEPPFYRREAYADHVTRVRQCFDAGAPAYSAGLARLAEQLEVPAAAIENLSGLAAALHDVGKLSVGWQDAIWRWQKRLTPTADRDAALAHSDYDASVGWQRKEARQREYLKPHHAAEGAYAVGPRLAATASAMCGSDMGGGVALALCSAIARHHGARTGQLQDFTLVPEAHDIPSVPDGGVPTSVRLRDGPKESSREHFGGHLIQPALPQEQPYLYPLYLFAVRRIRLADQASLGWMRREK